MLNGAGGFVLFGVRDDSCVDGQDVTSRTLEDVVHEIRRIEPHPPTQVMSQDEYRRRLLEDMHPVHRLGTWREMEAPGLSDRKSLDYNYVCV